MPASTVNSGTLQHQYALTTVLVVHAQWLPTDQGELLLWAEDSEMLAAPSRPPSRRASRADRPAPHPFAAPVERVVCSLAGMGAVGIETGVGVSTPTAHGEATGDVAVLWLPGSQRVPEASPELLRVGVDPGQGRVPGVPEISGPVSGPGLWPFATPMLRLGPSQAVDILLALAESRPGVLAGASVQAMATLVGLALEIVGAGRLIPGLYLDEKGCYTARWEPISGGDDEARPPSHRGLAPAGLPSPRPHRQRHCGAERPGPARAGPPRTQQLRRRRLP